MHVPRAKSLSGINMRLHPIATPSPETALHQLLRPVAGLLDALPEPQGDAARAALGHTVGGAGDRFLPGAGVLALLAEAAGPEGLICVVDDFQWADRASADALLFAARRLGTERIAMLFAVRGDAPVTGVTSTVGVRGLPEDAAAELLDGVPAWAAGRAGETGTHHADRGEPAGPGRDRRPADARSTRRP